MNQIISFIRTILRSIGQIMLQGNAATGFLFLIGIFYGSVVMGLAALLAATTGVASAYIFRFDKNDIEQGIYGFSPALVGVAVVMLLKPVLVSWILVLSGSIAAAYLQHFFHKRKIPVFTLPFVLVTWCIFYSCYYLSPGLVAENAVLIPSAIDKYVFAFKGYGQVIFQTSLFAGIAFFAGVFINSPRPALVALAGAVISGLAGYYFTSYETVNNGLLSYNAVLCAIALTGKKTEDGYWTLAAILLSVLIFLVMLHFQFLPLTFPFVVATCLIIFIRNKLTGLTRLT